MNSTRIPASVPSVPMQTAATKAFRSGAMLLVEKDALLRRTVALTARTLGIGHIHEAASQSAAIRMLGERSYYGAVIALDFGERRYAQYDFGLLNEIRTSADPACRDMPVAVLVDHCDTVLLQELRHRKVTRVILKPFRARTLLDTFSEFKEQLRQASELR